jgi:hypothetical protein
VLVLIVRTRTGVAHSISAEFWDPDRYLERCAAYAGRPLAALVFGVAEIKVHHGTVGRFCMILESRWPAIGSFNDIGLGQLQGKWIFERLVFVKSRYIVAAA